MAVVVTELVRDLKALRKGRGLLVGRIGERVGPALREVCELGHADGSVEIRRKVTDRLTTLAESLPEDLRIAVMAAFGLHPEARQPFYQDRVRWAAAQLRRDERTARRRVDVGIEALAELALNPVDAEATTGGRTTAWHTRKLWVTVSLDLETPEAFEYRRVVADRDELDELDLALTLTAAQRGDQAVFTELEVDVFRGGTLVGRSRETSDRCAFSLALPRPLMRGETHDFALRYRVPRGQPMQPHYVCVPKHRCDAFELNVRFSKARPPRRVWRLSDAFQRDVDDPVSGSGEMLSLDQAGEVHLSFTQLTPGLAYGVRWEQAQQLVATDPDKPNGSRHGLGHAEHHRP